MGGGGGQPIAPNQKYVLMIELYGPLNVDNAAAFEVQLAALLQNFQGSVVRRLYGDMRPGDPHPDEGQPVSPNVGT